MGRVSWGAAGVAAFALAACGDARVAQTPLAGESGCASCHSAPGEGPPFRDQTGATRESEPGKVSVGAHDAHLQAARARPLSCGDCHRTPQKVNAPGHLEPDQPSNVHFGPLARTGGASPTYAGAGCQASYCHGNFPGGNRSNAPGWLAGATAAQCGSCHGLPPPSGRHARHLEAGVRCDQCHGPMLRDTHVDGVVDLSLAGYDRQYKTCAQACHGPRSWPGPSDVPP